MIDFNQLLATEGTCARQTLISVLVESQKAYDAKAAVKRLNTYPGYDIIGIHPYVNAGMRSFSEQLQIPLESLVGETDLSPLEDVTSDQIFKALSSIHDCWINENFSALNWVEKFFARKLCFYLPAEALPFEVNKMNMLFIEKYLYAAGCLVNFADIEGCYIDARSSSKLDNAKMSLIDRAYSMQDEILTSFYNFRTRIKDPGLTERINLFLREGSMTPRGIVSRMVTAAIKNI